MNDIHHSLSALPINITSSTDSGATQEQHLIEANSRRKRIAAITLSVAALFGISSNDALANSKTSYAKVTSVTPIYETLTVKEPYEQCRLEKTVVKQANHHRQRQYSSATPTIIGALIGGAIGNELGHNKSNKRVGAVAGAILGGSIANDLKHRSPHHHSHNTRRYVTEEVCETHYSVRHEKQLTAYDVDYAYDGQIYNTTMTNHPGKRIRVAVDVTPIDY